MYEHEKNCDCPRCKPESQIWCSKHKCDKTWLVVSTFCPKCEKETHGDKGTTPPKKEWMELTDVEDIFGQIDLELDDPKVKFAKNFGAFICYSLARAPYCLSYHLKVRTDEDTWHKKVSHKELIGVSGPEGFLYDYWYHEWFDGLWELLKDD